MRYIQLILEPFALSLKIDTTMPIRAILLAIPMLVASAISNAQTAVAPQQPAGSNWQHVQALPIGTSIQVRAAKRPIVCTLTAVDATSLACDHNYRFEVHKLVFQRAEIRTVKLTRRGRSALLAAAIAAGAGATAGGIQGIHSNYFAVHGAFAMIYAFAGAFAGAPLGYFTDFSASTVYRAP
jgi:hypothetical protein